MEKPNTLVEDNPVSNVNTEVDGESYFFSYFMVVCILFVMGYVFYHNRAKVSFYKLGIEGRFCYAMYTYVLRVFVIVKAITFYLLICILNSIKIVIMS